jgi:hypothetical protein
MLLLHRYPRKKMVNFAAMCLGSSSSQRACPLFPPQTITGLMKTMGSLQCDHNNSGLETT